MSTKLVVVFCFAASLAFADARVAAWNADLDFMAEELEARHADLYHATPKSEFRERLNALRVRLGDLTDDQVVVETERLLTTVGDGHTGLFLPWTRGLNWHTLPIELYPAADGWIVLAASQAHSALAGTRVLRIGDLPIERAVARVLPLVPRDNEEGAAFLTREYVLLPELLVALGITKSANAIPFVVEDASGARHSVTVPAVPRNEKIEWVFSQLPLWIRRREEKYWSDYLPATKTLFVQFNSADIGRGDPAAQFAEFNDEVVRRARQSDVEKLVVDLRWNAGGSFYRARYLLWTLIRADHLNDPAKLFVIIGRNTFSAATSLATEIDWHTRATFVGAPTAGKPNSYGDLGRITLPNHKIEVRYSRYREQQSFVEDLRPAIVPELSAEPTIADFRNGNDPALQAIAAYRPKQPFLEELQRAYDAGKAARAIETWRQLRRDRYNEFLFDEDQLLAFGRRLAEAKDHDGAIAVLAANRDEYPYHAPTWAALGEVFLAKGDRERALDAFKRAFELDKRYTRYRDLLRQSFDIQPTR